MVRIDSTSSGEIVIDGKTYYSDMIVWWDGKKEFKIKFHQFTLDDFLSLSKRKPGFIVIGTGQGESVEISEKAEEMAEIKKIMIYVEKSPKAIEIFNGFIADGKKAVAVIHTD